MAITLKDNPEYEVVTKGYAQFEEYGVYYRRKGPSWIDLNKGFSIKKDMKKKYGTWRNM